MELRKATENDLSRCMELLNDQEDFKEANGDKPHLNFITEFLNEYFYVLTENDYVIGCYLATKIFKMGVYLWYVIVDENYRGKNIGTYILEEMEKIHIAEGREWIYFISPLRNIDFYSNRDFHAHPTVVKEFYKEYK